MLSDLQKYSPLKFFHILSQYNQKVQYVLIGFYMTDQHSVVHNFQQEWKTDAYVGFLGFFIYKLNAEH